MSPIEFCKFFGNWVASLPQGGNTPVLVMGKQLVARDLEKGPYFGQIFQAFLEGRLGELMLQWQ